MRTLRRFIQILVACAFLWTAIFAVADTGHYKATWSRPTTGSPCVSFDLEIWSEGQLVAAYLAIPDTTFDVPYQFPPNVPHVVRVLGRDAKERLGPWSAWSETITFDPGAPGACGAPVLTSR